MSANHIANLSQDYIDQLKTKTRHAENALTKKAKKYDAKSNELSDVSNWKAAIDVYWEKVKKSEELGVTVINNIEALLGQAKKVNSNVEATLEAVKLLVCNVRAASRVLDEMTEEYHELKSRIDKAISRDSNFKKDKIYEKLTALGDKLSVASQAAESMITKVLDLVKAYYILHRTMDSERQQYPHWITEHIYVEYVDENGILKPLELVESIEIECDGHIKQEPGLEWQLGKLKALLTEGPPSEATQHKEDHGDDHPQGPEKHANRAHNHGAEGITQPVFPLCEGLNRYYDVTKAEFKQAEADVKEVQKELRTAESHKLLAESSYKAYKASLDAAMAAKNGK